MKPSHEPSHTYRTGGYGRSAAPHHLHTSPYTTNQLNINNQNSGTENNNQGNQTYQQIISLFPMKQLQRFLLTPLTQLF